MEESLEGVPPDTPQASEQFHLYQQILMIPKIRMSTSIFLIITLCAVAGILLTGCKGEGGDTGPTGPEGPGGPSGPPGQNLTGTIRGFVYLKKEDGSFETVRKGVIARLEGTTIADTSDSTGRWQLDNVSAGAYSVSFSKTGYSVMKYPGTQFIGNGEYYLYPTLLQQSSFNVTSVTFFRTPTSLILNGLISSKSHDNRLVYLFLARNDSVSSTAFKQLRVITIKNDTTGFVDTLKQVAMNDAGFPSGTIFYAAAYGMNFDYPAQGDLYSYIEPSTGVRNFPGLSNIPKMFSASVP